MIHDVFDHFVLAFSEFLEIKHFFNQSRKLLFAWLFNTRYFNGFVLFLTFTVWTKVYFDEKWFWKWVLINVIDFTVFDLKFFVHSVLRLEDTVFGVFALIISHSTDELVLVLSFEVQSLVVHWFFDFFVGFVLFFLVFFIFGIFNFDILSVFFGIVFCLELWKFGLHLFLLFSSFPF